MSDVRLIDANALLRSFDVAWMVEYDETGCGVKRKAIPVKSIENAPTIDAVPVVRCRNCRLWRRTEAHYGKCPFLIGENQYTSEDGFCNLGEKKVAESE